MSKAQGQRYRASKKSVHLDAGWAWLVWDEEMTEFVDGLTYGSKELAEKAARALNAMDAEIALSDEAR